MRGHWPLLVPGVTALVQNGDRFLIDCQSESRRWGLINGGVEPGEEPRAALQREVRDELGVGGDIIRINGAHGGSLLENVYPNGDHVEYVTVAYLCSLDAAAFALLRGRSAVGHSQRAR